MNSQGRNHCDTAMRLIRANEYGAAILHLRCALRQTGDRKAWSKIMLAIRELSRIAPQATS